MIKLAGFTPDVDIKIDVVGLRPGEKLYEELLNDSARTIRTHHEKIMIAQEKEEQFEELHQDIIELISGSVVYDNEAIVAQMKKIVPEFKSMNSTFEVLDN
jgi:FlaA1/EpsC-like NDP-sugar epimerase